LKTLIGNGPLFSLEWAKTGVSLGAGGDPWLVELFLGGSVSVLLLPGGT